MKPLNKTIVLLGVATICMVVAGGIYLFFFISMKNKTQDAVALSAKLGEISSAQLRYVASGSALQSEQTNIDKLSSYFIREDDIVSFTKKIETLGNEAGVDLTIESLDPGSTTAGVPYLNFRITAEGGFENTERLLFLLQNFPGKFVWQNVRLAREGDISATSGGVASKWKVDATLIASNFIRE